MAPLNSKVRVASGNKVHLDPGLDLVPSREMMESIHRHRAAKLAVDPMQEVQIECRRYPLLVVIGRQQQIQVFDAIDADQQH